MPNIWMSTSEIMSLPTSGAAWTAVKSAASSLVPGNANISDQNSLHDVNTLAAALAGIRENNAAFKAKVGAACNAAMGTESGARTLALGRNLACYVLAADQVGYRDPVFVSWVDKVRTKSLDGDTLISTHERRPNNWGTQCGMGRVAADLYLGDKTDLARAINVVKGWLGNRNAYAGFKFADGNTWHPDQSKPVAVNPKGSTIQGKPVDGVLPDDQRRAGGFTWPPPCENYVMGALGPVIVTVEMLRHNGYPDAHLWSDAACKRAVAWFCGTMGGKNACSFVGDDGWQPGLIDFLYGRGIAKGGSPTAIGKSFGWTWWSHGTRSVGSATPPVTPPVEPPPSTTDPCATQKQAVKLAQDGLAAAQKALADCQAANS
jgi:hypothetical protein